MSELPACAGRTPAADDAEYRADTPKAVAAAFLDAWNRHDLAAIRRVSADDIIEVMPGALAREGIDNELEFIADLFAAFPDLRIEVSRLMAVDDVVAAVWTRRGTFTGADFQGLPANGAKIDSEAAGFFEIERGRVKRLTVYADMNKFGRDLGLVPAEDSPAERVAIALFRGRVRLRRMSAAVRRRRARQLSNAGS